MKAGSYNIICGITDFVSEVYFCRLTSENEIIKQKNMQPD